MASIYQDEKSKVYRILFRFGKPPKQFHKSLDTTDQKEAEGLEGRVEDTLRAIEQGWLTVPPHADFWQFVFSGGKLEAKPSVQEVLTLDKLFTKFFRAQHPLVREAGGTGLGLAIARALVELHGGTLTVVSTPSQGSTFNVTLPAAHALTS